MKSLLRLKPYIRPHLKLLIASLLLSIPVAALRSLPVLGVERIMDDLWKSKDEGRVLFYAWMIIAVYVANFVFRFLHFYFQRLVVVRVNQKIKNDLYDHILGLSADYFTTKGTGTLISRVGQDPNTIDAGIAGLGTMVREPLTFLFLLGRCFYLNWVLTCITLVLLPSLAWVFRATGRNMKRYMNRMAEENANLFHRVQEAFSGIRIVKMFGLEPYVKNKFRETNASFAKFSLKTAVIEEAAHPTVELLTAFALAALIYYGGLQAVRGQMTQGEFLAFFTAFAMMIAPLRTLNDVNMKMSQASAACDRVFGLFDWKSNLSESKAPEKLKEPFNQIEFKDVTFAYPDSPDRNVLKAISFQIPRGKVVALVGASGAGKSSVVSLLPRIFDVTGGGILIDGKDIREISLLDLRKLIAVVSQDVFLFNDTIEENIRCGSLNASDQEIRDAAKKAHALEFIDRLPEGIRTVIGERGQKLSGGERQRLSIARAFLRQSPFLILDEATSSLDTASERAVQAALEELMLGKTTLVIAHRLSTIQHADQILVIKEGQIVESGRHEDLLTKGKEYARFYRLTEATEVN